MSRAGLRIGSLAVVTAGLATAAGWSWIERDRADQAVHAAAEGPADAQLTAAANTFGESATVLDRLDIERDATTTRLRTPGPDGSLVSPLGSEPTPAPEVPQMRESTDEAIASLRAALDDRDDATARALGPAAEILGRLPALRADVDALLAAEPGSAQDTIDRTTIVFLRYSVVIATINEANVAVAETVDLPSGNDLVVLEARAVALSSTAADLAEALGAASLSEGIDTPADLEAVNVLLDGIETQGSAIKASDERHRYIVEQSFPEALHTELVAKAREVLSGAPPTFAPYSLESMVDATGGDSYDEMHEHIVFVIGSDAAARRAERVDAAEDRLRPWTMAWTATAALTGLSLLALVAAGFHAVRSRPRRDEPHDDLATLVAIPPYRPRP